MKAKKVMKEGWKKNGRTQRVKNTKKGVFVKNNEVIKMEDSQKRHKKSRKRRRKNEKKNTKKQKKKGTSTEKTFKKKKDILSNAGSLKK